MRRRHRQVILLVLILLLGVAVQAGNRPTRTLTIKIVADQHFASQEVWERKASRLIEDAAEDIRELLEVDLEIVGYEVWNHRDEDDPYFLASQLVRDVSRDGADALIAFTYVPCPPDDAGAHIDGVTLPFRGMIIRNYWPACPRNDIIPYAIIHEMIHFFGGVHAGHGHLMSPVLRGEVMLDLDPLNRRIVRLTRDIDFGTGFESLDRQSLETLAGLYLYAIDNGNRDMAVLFDLGEIYAVLGQYGSAILIYEKLLEIDSTLSRTWMALADVYLRSHYPDSALMLLEESLDHAEDIGRVLYRMARLYFERGDYDTAYDYAARAAWQGIEVDTVFRRLLEEHRKMAEPRPRTLPRKK